jgi:hypothetical protein
MSTTLLIAACQSWASPRPTPFFPLLSCTHPPGSYCPGPGVLLFRCSGVGLTPNVKEELDLRTLVMSGLYSRGEGVSSPVGWHAYVAYPMAVLKHL